MKGDAAEEGLHPMLKLAIATLAAVSLSPTVLHAEDGPSAVVTVSYADLNLSTDAGAATLQNRIKIALKSVYERPPMRELKAVSAWQKCRADARRNAVAQIDDARLPVQLAAR